MDTAWYTTVLQLHWYSSNCDIIKPHVRHKTASFCTHVGSPFNTSFLATQNTSNHYLKPTSADHRSLLREPLGPRPECAHPGTVTAAVWWKMEGCGWGLLLDRMSLWLKNGLMKPSNSSGQTVKQNLHFLFWVWFDSSIRINQAFPTGPQFSFPCWEGSGCVVLTETGRNFGQPHACIKGSFSKKWPSAAAKNSEIRFGLPSSAVSSPMGAAREDVWHVIKTYWPLLLGNALEWYEPRLVRLKNRS